MNHRPPAQHQQGFTLLEILVAVALLAIVMGALLGSLARYADQAAHLRNRSIATWVAHNRLTEVELDSAWPSPGASDGDTEMAGVKWQWRQTVNATDDPTLRRVDVRVYAPGTKLDAISGIGDDQGPAADASLTAFISSAGP